MRKALHSWFSTVLGGFMVVGLFWCIFAGLGSISAVIVENWKVVAITVLALAGGITALASRSIALAIGVTFCTAVLEALFGLLIYWVGAGLFEWLSGMIKPSLTTWEGAAVLAGVFTLLWLLPSKKQAQTSGRAQPVTVTEQEPSRPIQGDHVVEVIDLPREGDNHREVIRVTVRGTQS